MYNRTEHIACDPGKARRNFLLHGIRFGDAEMVAVVAKRIVTMRKHYDFSKAKRGAAISTSQKIRITIMLDDDVRQCRANETHEKSQHR